MTDQRYNSGQYDTPTGLSRRVVAQLFRGRPYTKAIPFEFILTGTLGATFLLWSPVNAYFEIALIQSKSTVPLDLALADTDGSLVIGFIGPDGTNSYGPGTLDFGISGFRSQNHINPKLLLVDGGVAGTVKGTVYGWEVTDNGDYR